MTRGMMLVTMVLLAASCDKKRQTDLFDDKYPADFRAGYCLRSDLHPPRERCEAIAREAARLIIKKRSTATYADVACGEVLKAALKFAPRSTELRPLKEACCNFPGQKIPDDIAALCAPEYP